MSLDQPDSLNFDGRYLRFGLIAARFNLRMVDAMLENCVNVWEQAGVAPSNVELQRVPGSNELPYAAAMLAKTLQFDAIVVLGLVLAGETPHHEVIADSTGQSLQRIGLDTEEPKLKLALSERLTVGGSLVSPLSKWAFLSANYPSALTSLSLSKDRRAEKSGMVSRKRATLGNSNSFNINNLL